jgi:hypothetical protein
MSIYPVSIAIISGQKNSGEIAVSASTLLARDWQSVTPVCTEKSVRKELLSALENYVLLDKVYSSQPPGYYAKQLLEPNKNIATTHHFCLALDLEGYLIAKDIFLANGDAPDEKVYDFVCKLNLLDQRVLPPPNSILSIDYLTKIKNSLFLLSKDYGKLQIKEPFLSFIKKRIPMTDNEQEYYSWFRTLYEYITPWKNIISKLQSDWS